MAAGPDGSGRAVAIDKPVALFAQNSSRLSTAIWRGMHVQPSDIFCPFPAHSGLVLIVMLTKISTVDNEHLICG